MQYLHCMMRYLYAMPILYVAIFICNAYTVCCNICMQCLHYMLQYIVCNGYIICCNILYVWCAIRMSHYIIHDVQCVVYTIVCTQTTLQHFNSGRGSGNETILHRISCWRNPFLLPYNLGTRLNSPPTSHTHTHTHTHTHLCCLSSSLHTHLKIHSTVLKRFSPWQPCYKYITSSCSQADRRPQLSVGNSTTYLHSHPPCTSLIPSMVWKYRNVTIVYIGTHCSYQCFEALYAAAVPCGLVVRIRRSHRRGRGSIPRMGESNFFFSPQIH